MIERVIEKGKVLKSQVINGITWTLYSYGGSLYKVAVENNEIIRYIHYPAQGRREVIDVHGVT